MIDENRSVLLKKQAATDPSRIRVKDGEIGAPGRPIINGLLRGNVIDKIIRRHAVIVVPGVEMMAELELFEIAQTLDALSRHF